MGESSIDLINDKNLSASIKYLITRKQFTRIETRRGKNEKSALTKINKNQALIISKEIYKGGKMSFLSGL